MKYLLNIFHFQSILGAKLPLPLPCLPPNWLPCPRVAADVDVNAAALVVVLPRRNKKAQPKEQTS